MKIGLLSIVYQKSISYFLIDISATKAATFAKGLVPA